MLEYSKAVAVQRGELEELTAFAVSLAERAGESTLPHFRTALSVEDKRTGGRFDPVTVADREAEQIIRAGIERAYPAHGVLGEEFGHLEGNGLTWVIDPIDGTRAFMAGMLHWGVLLALFDGQQPVLGVMHQPFTGETFFGNNDAAYYRRAGEERILQCRSCEAIGEAVLTTTTPKLFRGSERKAFDRLEAEVRLSRYGGDCYIYAMLAMGQVDLATDAGLNPYDIQALMPIVRGAGGVVTTVDGGNASMGGFIVAAGSASLHRLALECMTGG
jgi:histidinol phosphatase-like enzyme (inositol monophosphatase family)